MKVINALDSARIALLFLTATTVMGFIGANSAYSATVENFSKLSVAVPYLPEYIDALQHQDPVNLLILANISRPLIREKCDGEVSPALAQTFSISSDRQEWQLGLRGDISLPSGKTLLPEDVIASLRYFQQQATATLEGRARLGSGGSGSKLPHLSSLTLLPDHATVEAAARFVEAELVADAAPMNLHRNSLNIRVKSNSPNVSLQTILGTLPILDAQLADVFGDRLGANTLLPTVGPYWVRSNSSTDGLVLERNPGFYDKSPFGAAVIVVRSFSDSLAAVSALRTGVVEIIFLPTFQALSVIKNDPTLEIVKLPALTCKAMKHAVPSREFWSDPGNELDRLSMDTLIVRKGFKLDQKALENLDLSGSYLP